MWMSQQEKDEFRQHMIKCDERDERNRQVDAEIIVELKQLAKGYSQHMDWEEKDREVQREEAKANTRALQAIVDRLTGIEKEMIQQPAAIKESMYCTRDEIMDWVRQNFATRTDLNGAMDTLRSNVKYTWYAVATTIATMAWFYTNTPFLKG